MASKITVFRGVSYPVIYNHTDSTGAAVPLTNKRLYFTVKSDVYDTSGTDSTALIQKTITSHTGTVGTTTLNAATGVSGFLLTDADTYIAPGKYHFDFVIEDAITNESEPPSVYGDFIVTGHPTNRVVGNE